MSDTATVVIVDESDPAVQARKAAADDATAAAARAKKYGIGLKDGGHRTPPQGYPAADSDYGDPTNYRYPIDEAHIAPAVSYFNHDGQREAGGYTTAEWAVIGKRIAARAGKVYQGGQVVDKADASKSVDLREGIDQIETAFHVRFDPSDDNGPMAKSLWIQHTLDDQIIAEGPDGLCSYPYVRAADGTITWGEPVRVRVVYEAIPTANKSAIKTISEDAAGLVIGGHEVLWGSVKDKDFHGDFFTQKTGLGLDTYQSAPLLFHHSLDPAIGLEVIGHRVKAVTDDTGLWVEHWLDKGNQFFARVKALLDAGALHYSPGSVEHLIRRQKTGELTNFPIIEDSLTVAPAQYRLRPVAAVKAAYQAAHMPEPGGLELSGDDAGASCAAARAKARAVLADLETDE
jgi:hypothetical protein